eukprot:338504-Pleurochrysis_carterae.AAC.1
MTACCAAPSSATVGGGAFASAVAAPWAIALSAAASPLASSVVGSLSSSKRARRWAPLRSLSVSRVAVMAGRPATGLSSAPFFVVEAGAVGTASRGRPDAVL